MRREPLLHTTGQHRYAILLSFAAPDHDLVAIEIEVLDALHVEVSHAEAQPLLFRGGSTRAQLTEFSFTKPEPWNSHLKLKTHNL